MSARTEIQIMEKWQHQEQPLVSITCITYNHEPYITDAIEGFLKQKTTFPFEIIIHDDASTDKTSDIIRNYAEKYPKIIKPIFQKENQSTRLKKNALLPIILTAVSHTKGEFIAYCDGDDYWTNSNKLQIQISEMQKYPTCDISFHPVFRRCDNGKKREKIIANHSQKNKIFRTEKIILGTAQFCPPVSFIFRRKVFTSIPQWLLDAPCSDYFLQILASLRGGAIYVKNAMAVYRALSAGSWTEKMSWDEELVSHYFFDMLSSLDDINAQTNNQYKKEFNIIKKKLCFYMCINPVLSLEKRKEIFGKNKKRFGSIRKITWYILFRNHKLSKLIFDVRSYFLG